MNYLPLKYFNQLYNMLGIFINKTNYSLFLQVIEMKGEIVMYDIKGLVYGITVSVYQR